jgi:hypothetical protein
VIIVSISGVMRQWWGDPTEVPTLRSPAPVGLLALIHPSAGKGNSQKSVCRLLHSPARWPSYGRPETSRLLEVDHYIAHVRIEMRLGGCAIFLQNTDTDTRGGVVRCFDPGSVTRGTACLTYVCVQGYLKVVICGQARRVLETTFFAWRDL